MVDYKPVGISEDNEFPPRVQTHIEGLVSAAVSALVGGAPGILDTLGEIASALASDESTAGALATTVAGKLSTASNLSDVPSPATARTNLGVDTAIATAISNLVNGAPGILDTLGEIATQLASDETVAGALATTVAGKLAKASNLSDLVSASTARTNLGLAASAALGAQYAYRTVDSSPANSTTAPLGSPLTDATITIPVAANSVYFIDGVIYYSASLTADMRFQWSIPSAASGYWGSQGLGTGIASGATAGSLFMSRVALSTFSTVGGAGVATFLAIRPKGLLVTGANAGNFALQYIQEVPEATDAVVAAGSHLKLTKVA